MIWSKCSKGIYVAKADGRKSFMESLNVKSVRNVIAGFKCMVQNNKKNTRNADNCYVNYES